VVLGRGDEMGGVEGKGMHGWRCGAVAIALAMDDRDMTETERERQKNVGRCGVVWCGCIYPIRSKSTMQKDIPSTFATKDT
jgi:hypothetical protein